MTKQKSHRTVPWAPLQVLTVIALALSTGPASAKAGGPAKETRVILLWLEGGPSHIDLWDMKPAAPAEYRGYWRPIPTNVAGMQITEMFPRQAKLADKFSIIRTLHHDDGDHIGSPHIMLTGRVGPLSDRTLASLLSPTTSTSAWARAS